ncbi:hypothetical protein [Nocardia carnea]|uniref:hypothetical protein n=1 Tax=Nocardia carnea TaxID=37328 RepID=UPI002456CB84|nr:hypothetical protein [Nocardia carnea]
MTGEPLYDPDRMVVDDLDLSDPDVADAYLSHSTTDKLMDDLGREFRRQPSAYQQRVLSEDLGRFEKDRAELASTVAGLDPDAPEREALQPLLDKLNGYIEAMKLRMLELDE